MPSPDDEVWKCFGCGRVGSSPSDLLRQGCEGKPEKLVRVGELEDVLGSLELLMAEGDVKQAINTLERYGKA